jgi:hypothetical protein
MHPSDRAYWHVCAELEQACSAAMAVLGWGMLLLTGVAAGFYFVFARRGNTPGATSKRRVAQGTFPHALPSQWVRSPNSLTLPTSGSFSWACFYVFSWPGIVKTCGSACHRTG